MTTWSCFTRIARREPRAVERHRAEAGGLGPALQPFEVEPAGAEQVHREVALDPALQQRVGGGGIVADDVELGVGVGVLHRRPAVGGGLGLVHDQHAQRALARGLLVLVGPAAVIGHGPAAEAPGGGVLEVRVVDQDDGDLALQVDALEVVPAALGRLDAVAHEHHGRVADIHLVHRQQGLDHDLVALGQGPPLAVQAEAQGHRISHLEAVKGDGLGPAAVLAAGLQLHGGELAGQVVDHLGLGVGGRAAALEGVRSQHLNGLGHARRVHRRLDRTLGSAAGDQPRERGDSERRRDATS